MWLFLSKWLEKYLLYFHYLSAVVLISLWTTKVRFQCEEFAQSTDSPFKSRVSLHFGPSLKVGSCKLTCQSSMLWWVTTGLSFKQNNAFTLGIFLFSTCLSWDGRPVTATAAALKATHKCLKWELSTALSNRWISLSINLGSTWYHSSLQSKQSAPNLEGYDFPQQMWRLLA